MRLRLLGVNNVEAAETPLSGGLVDGVLALDTGSLTRSLALSEQRRVRHVLLTHQHYDHVRDVPTLAFATRDAGTLHVHGLTETLEALTSHLLNDVLYGAYHKRTREGGTPGLVLHPMEFGSSQDVAGYTVLPLPAFHSVPAIGYAVSQRGHILVYTGDTGPGFASAIDSALPNLLLAETTYANAASNLAHRNGHLTPHTLHDEIAELVKRTGWTPRVVVTHMDPAHQATIEQEIAMIRQETGWDIVTGRVGMMLEV
jgi:ribonuclease BN (tRNA processing enzyme)